MTDCDGLLSDVPRKSRISRFRPAALILIPLVAILFQAYVPMFFQYVAYLELPLLVTVYFALIQRSPVGGLFLGAGIGLAQDSLAGHPVGMFGIVKTLVGYFAASVSLRLDMDNPLVRLILAFFFFFFHQFFYWVLTRALLGQQLAFDMQLTAFSGLLNAAVALPLFHLLDKLKETG